MYRSYIPFSLIFSKFSKTDVRHFTFIILEFLHFSKQTFIILHFTVLISELRRSYIRFSLIFSKFFEADVHYFRAIFFKTNIYHFTFYISELWYIFEIWFFLTFLAMSIYIQSSKILLKSFLNFPKHVHHFTFLISKLRRWYIQSSILLKYFLNFLKQIFVILHFSF